MKTPLISESLGMLILVVVFASGYMTGLNKGVDKCPTQPIIWEHTTVPQDKEF